MFRLIIGLGFATLSLSLPALAQGASGTADEAKAMLTKAVAAVKADKAKALEIFNKGEGGFKDRDLYPFCANISDGKLIANSNRPQLVGQDGRTFKDSTGRNFGQEVYDAAAKAKDGEIVVSSPFLFPRPGPDQTPVQKVAFLSKIGDIYCGVGYYK
jgi:Single Cache domain 2